MAIVKGILVNDGGAPARIINFTAGEAISAGMVVKASDATAGEVLKATEQGASPAGVALTDAASGDQCSVITGSGSVCYILTQNVGLGALLMVDEGGTAGYLDVRGADSDADFAVTLENNSGAGLTKCLIL